MAGKLDAEELALATRALDDHGQLWDLGGAAEGNADLADFLQTLCSNSKPRPVRGTVVVLAMGTQRAVALSDATPLDFDAVRGHVDAYLHARYDAEEFCDDADILLSDFGLQADVGNPAKFCIVGVTADSLCVDDDCVVTGLASCIARTDYLYVSWLCTAKMARRAAGTALYVSGSDLLQGAVVLARTLRLPRIKLRPIDSGVVPFYTRFGFLPAGENMEYYVAPLAALDGCALPEPIPPSPRLLWPPLPMDALKVLQATGRRIGRQRGRGENARWAHVGPGANTVLVAPLRCLVFRDEDAATAAASVLQYDYGCAWPRDRAALAAVTRHPFGVCVEVLYVVDVLDTDGVRDAEAVGDGVLVGAPDVSGPLPRDAPVHPGFVGRMRVVGRDRDRD